MKSPAITSFIAALVLGVAALAHGRQPPAAPCVLARLKGEPTLTEWYSDVPWHQKLGTYAGNEIKVPLIMPYEVLPDAAKTYCNSRKLPASPRKPA